VLRERAPDREGSHQAAAPRRCTAAQPVAASQVVPA